MEEDALHHLTHHSTSILLILILDWRSAWDYSRDWRGEGGGLLSWLLHERVFCNSQKTCWKPCLARPWQWFQSVFYLVQKNPLPFIAGIPVSGTPSEVEWMWRVQSSEFRVQCSWAHTWTGMTIFTIHDWLNWSQIVKLYRTVSLPHKTPGKDFYAEVHLLSNYTPSLCANKVWDFLSEVGSKWLE